MKRIFLFFGISAATLFTTAQTLDTIQLTWKGGDKKILFGCHAFNIDWGDGLTEQKLGMASTSITHTYADTTQDYNVTIIDRMGISTYDIRCSSQQISRLDISRHRFLLYVECFDNHLTLSELYGIVENIQGSSNPRLETQRLFPQQIVMGSPLDYSSEKEFGGVLTNFEVEKNHGFPAVLNTDYTIYDGIIVFKTAGKFTVTMTNSAVRSSVSPAVVIAEIDVVYPNTDATLSFLGVSYGKLNPAFDSTVVNYTVCIGDYKGEIVITATPTDTNATVSGDIGWHIITKDTTVLTVIVTAQDGTTTKKYFVTITRCNVGIAEIESEELQIKSYEIFDILGNCLHSSPSSPENTIITEIPRLPRGIYIIKTQTNKGTIIRKIINNQ